MTNYFKDSKLIKCNSKYEVYAFEVVNDLYEIFISNSINQIDIDFGHNIIRIPDGKDSVFSLSTDKCHSNEILINVDRNNNLLNNLGKLKERIIVKENYQLNITNKRKINSDQLNDNQPSAKKSLAEQQNDSDNDVSSRSSTRPKAATSFSMKTKISVLDELKLGKSIKHISNSLNISESKIKEFQSKESEIRRQYHESVIERAESNNSSSQPQISKQMTLEKPNAKSTAQTNKFQPNVRKMNEISSPDSNRSVFLNLDYDLTRKNGKLVFSDYLKKASVDLPKLGFQLPKDHPDIPKIDLPHSTNLKRAPISKPIKKLPTDLKNCSSNPLLTVREKSVKNSSETGTPIMQESKKPPNVEKKQLQLEKKPPQMEKKSLGVEKLSPQLEIKPSSVAEPATKRHSKRPESILDIRINKHYPTDPVGKFQQNQPMIQTKSSTNQYKPPNIPSPFRYVVMDPSATDFVPSENVNPDLKSTNIDSEDFIDEVQKLYERFSECAKIYDKYRLKRNDLRDRVCNIKSNKEISELHKEIYRLVEEEKRPFFRNLEMEVTILQNKLTKVADLLGIKLNL